MFVRVKKHPYTAKSTVLICHTKRVEKHNKQIVLCKIGTSDEPQQLELMKTTAERIIVQMKKQTKMQQEQNLTFPTLMHAREINRLNTGIKDIVGTLYDQLGFNHILDTTKMNELLKAVVLARFTEPSSKLKTSSILQRKFSLEYSEDSIYRMMDALYKKTDQLKQIVFASTVTIVGDQIDLMFFDVTTLYFETIEEDELRQFGFSKDFRFNTTQVVLALATTCTGLPIGYKLFPGNTDEVTTLINCVKEWKTQIGIREAIVVADRGMMSDNNLKQLIAEDARWDGLHGVLTNTDLTAEEIINRYKKLLVIEESFLINKHNLKMRPIYHFTPKRIYSHIAICFLTYTLIRQIQHILKQHKLELSIETIREELLDVQASIIVDTNTGELYKMPSYMPEEIKQVYRIFGQEAELKTRPYLAD